MRTSIAGTMGAILLVVLPGGNHASTRGSTSHDPVAVTTAGVCRGTAHYRASLTQSDVTTSLIIEVFEAGNRRKTWETSSFTDARLADGTSASSNASGSYQVARSERFSVRLEAQTGTRNTFRMSAIRSDRRDSCRISIDLRR